MEIGILGGTGKAGKGLAARLAQANYKVIIGSRSIERAEAEADELNKKWSLNLKAGENSLAAEADIVIVATTPESAIETVRNYSSQMRNKIVISMCNKLQRTPEGYFLPAIENEGSIATHIQKELPESQVAATFHHLPATELNRLATPLKNHILVCTDFAAALKTTSEIIESIKNLQPLNAGPLANSASLEAFTSTLLNLSKIYKANASIEITGLT